MHTHLRVLASPAFSPTVFAPPGCGAMQSCYSERAEKVPVSGQPRSTRQLSIGSQEMGSDGVILEAGSLGAGETDRPACVWVQKPSRNDFSFTNRRTPHSQQCQLLAPQQCWMHCIPLLCSQGCTQSLAPTQAGSCACKTAEAAFLKHIPRETITNSRLNHTQILRGDKHQGMQNLHQTPSGTAAISSQNFIPGKRRELQQRALRCRERASEPAAQQRPGDSRVQHAARRWL